MLFNYDFAVIYGPGKLARANPDPFPFILVCINEPFHHAEFNLAIGKNG